MIIGLTFVMKHTGSRSCDLSIIQENGVMTLSGWNVDLFEFQTVQCWQLFLYNSSTKRRRTYGKALQSLVRMPLSSTMFVKHHVFMLVKL